MSDAFVQPSVSAHAAVSTYRVQGVCDFDEVYKVARCVRMSANARKRLCGAVYAVRDRQHDRKDVTTAERDTAELLRSGSMHSAQSKPPADCVGRWYVCSSVRKPDAMRSPLKLGGTSVKKAGLYLIVTAPPDRSWCSREFGLDTKCRKLQAMFIFIPRRSSKYG